MKNLIVLACALGAFAAMPASASTMNVNFPGGEISDEKDEEDKPTGHKLYMTKELKLKKSVNLKMNEFTTIKTNFGKKTVTIFDDKPNSDESLHVEINGKVINEVNYTVKYLNDKGRWKYAGAGKASGNTGKTQAADQKNTDIISSIMVGAEFDAMADMHGLSIIISNKNITTLTLTSVSIGVDSERITEQEESQEVTAQPIPASGLLLGGVLVGAWVLRRRRAA